MSDVRRRGCPMTTWVERHQVSADEILTDGWSVGFVLFFSIFLDKFDPTRCGRPMNREDPNFWRMASSYLIVSMDGECFIFGVNDLNELDKAVRFFLLTCHLTIWLC